MEQGRDASNHGSNASLLQGREPGCGSATKPRPVVAGVNASAGNEAEVTIDRTQLDVNKRETNILGQAVESNEEPAHVKAAQIGPGGQTPGRAQRFQQDRRTSSTT